MVVIPGCAEIHEGAELGRGLGIKAQISPVNGLVAVFVMRPEVIPCVLTVRVGLPRVKLGTLPFQTSEMGDKDISKPCVLC